MKTMNYSQTENYDEQLPTTLYHYCTCKTFKSIFKNQELWLSSTKDMNDKDEQRYFIDGLFKSVRQNIPEEKYQLCDEIYNMAEKDLDKSWPYAFCFSKLEDDAAQWERYADKAKGICIGFNTVKIEQIFQHSVILKNIAYEYDVKKHRHYEILKEYIIHNKLLDSFESIQGVVENIVACAYRFKNASFSSEKETRLAVLPAIAQNEEVFSIKKRKCQLKKNIY